MTRVKSLFPGAVRRGINQSAMGVADPASAVPDPVPRYVPPNEWRPGETDEARVWRRFPITAHKPARHDR
jgi:hypothetical protein